MRCIVLSLSLSLALVASVPAAADVSLRWQSTESSLSPLLAKYLRESNVIADFVALVEENFVFEQPLVLELGASSGPAYEPASNTISMPYSFFERAVFTQSMLSDGDGDVNSSNAVQRGVDVLEYTLYHLLGHSLVSDADEDSDSAVEALSTFIMVAYWPNGAEQWAADIEAFGAASQRLDGPLSDYWHSHSLYKERQRILLCWVQGSVEEQDRISSSIEQAADNDNDNDEAYQQCRASWNNLVKASGLLLEPYLRADSALSRALGL